MLWAFCFLLFGFWCLLVDLCVALCFLTSACYFAGFAFGFCLLLFDVCFVLVAFVLFAFCLGHFALSWLRFGWLCCALGYFSL